jgi:hypothetical protein
MLEKLKSYFIILLVLSLSFTPSVNAASDIFDEPRHIDYNTYKERMIEYIETPDYLKPSMPPIVGRNEYVDTNDIFLAVDDLLTVMPVINNDSLNEIKKTSTFKNMNSLLVEKVNGVRELFDLSIENVRPYLNPYMNNPNLAAEVTLYGEYNFAANRIKNIISDTLLLEQSGVNNIFRTNGESHVRVGSVDYTQNELLLRVSTAEILPDGTYKFTVVEPLASGVTPKSVSVNSVGAILKRDFVVSRSGRLCANNKNLVLTQNSLPVMGTNSEPLPFKTTNEGVNPQFLMEKGNPNTEIVVNTAPASGTIVTYDLRSNSDGRRVIMEPEIIKSNNERLGLFVNDGKVQGENFRNEPIDIFGGVESGVFFVLAIVSFVLAWVYK